MLPELSGARSVAPQAKTFGAMSCLGYLFMLRWSSLRSDLPQFSALNGVSQIMLLPEKRVSASWASV